MTLCFRNVMLCEFNIWAHHNLFCFANFSDCRASCYVIQIFRFSTSCYVMLFNLSFLSDFIFVILRRLSLIFGLVMPYYMMLIFQLVTSLLYYFKFLGMLRHVTFNFWLVAPSLTLISNSSRLHYVT